MASSADKQDSDDSLEWEHYQSIGSAGSRIPRPYRSSIQATKSDSVEYAEPEGIAPFSKVQRRSSVASASAIKKFISSTLQQQRRASSSTRSRLPHPPLLLTDGMTKVEQMRLGRPPHSPRPSRPDNFLLRNLDSLRAKPPVESTDGSNPQTSRSASPLLRGSPRYHQLENLGRRFSRGSSIEGTQLTHSESEQLSSVHFGVGALGSSSTVTTLRSVELKESSTPKCNVNAAIAADSTSVKSQYSSESGDSLLVRGPGQQQEPNKPESQVALLYGPLSQQITATSNSVGAQPRCNKDLREISRYSSSPSHLPFPALPHGSTSRPFPPGADGFSNKVKERQLSRVPAVRVILLARKTSNTSVIFLLIAVLVLVFRWGGKQLVDALFEKEILDQFIA